MEKPIFRLHVFIYLQGKISFNNLKRVAKELGENLTDEELQVCMHNSTHIREAPALEQHPHVVHGHCLRA